MIRSFADKEAEKLFDRKISRKLPQDIQNIARRKLEILHAAENIQDLPSLSEPSAVADGLTRSFDTPASIEASLQPPATAGGSDPLGRERKDEHSIRINDQWRICFRWHENDAFEVEIVDYH